MEMAFSITDEKAIFLMTHDFANPHLNLCIIA